MFAVFLTAASSGVPITVSRLMAKSGASGDTQGKHAAVTAGIVSTLVITIPIAIILFFGRSAFGFLFSDDRCMDIFIILLPGLVLTSVYSVIRGSFWGNKQFVPYSVIELLEDAIMVVAGVWLVWGVSDPVDGARLAIIAVLISYVFSFCVSLFWYFRKGGRMANPKPQLKPLFSAAAPITAMRTSTSLLNSAVAVILPLLLVNVCGYTNSEALALYGIVLGMAVPLIYSPNALIGSIAVVVAPELSENYYKKRDDAVRYDIEKTIKAAVFIAALLVPVLFVLGSALSIFLYDSELCGKIVTISSFMILPTCITMITNTVLNSMNCEKRTLVYFFIGAAVMLICLLFLTRYMGVYAYVLGISLSQIICAVLNLIYLSKKCPKLNYMRYLVHSILVITAACLFGWLLNGIISKYLAPVWQILICAPLIIAFTAVSLYCLEMFSMHPFKRLFAKK